MEGLSRLNPGGREALPGGGRPYRVGWNSQPTRPEYYTRLSDKRTYSPPYPGFRLPDAFSIAERMLLAASA